MLTGRAAQNPLAGWSPKEGLPKEGFQNLGNDKREV